jgi:hypothetical protein
MGTDTAAATVALTEATIAALGVELTGDLTGAVALKAVAPKAVKVMTAAGKAAAKQKLLNLLACCSPQAAPASNSAGAALCLHSNQSASNASAKNLVRCTATKRGKSR